MNRRIVISSAVLLALVVTTAYAQDKEKVYKEPKDVFAAAKKAAKDGDYKAFYTTLTPDSADMMTGQMVMVGIMLKSFAEFDKTGKTAEAAKGVFAAMTKHGMTEEAIKKMKPLDPKAKPDAQLKAIKEMIKPIKKPGDFIGDMMTAMKKMNPKGGGLDEIANDELKDLKIDKDGNKATGNAVGKRGGKESKTELKFEKIKGSWKIVLPQPKQKTDDD